ncbi:MAG: CPBP family intramembrane metalloprotease [Firmicutes bacterium]|nr:CPBP family intramembrane metalloprotease [Bacillota bacterium]
MDRPSKANIFMLFFLCYSGILPFVLVLALAPFGESFYTSFVLLLGHVFIFGVPMILYCSFTKTRFGDIIPHEPLSIVNIILIIFITIFTMPLMTWVASLTSVFADNATGEAIDSYMSRYPMAYMVVSVAVMPAVFEELSFRGFMMSGYKRCGIVKSIIFSALFFGIMHLDLYQLPYATAAGIIMGILVHYTNSIYSSMIAHFIINGSQVVLGMLFADAESAAEEVSSIEQIQAASLLLFLTLPILIGLLFAFIKINSGKNIDYKYSLSPKREFETDIVEDKVKDRILDFSFVMVIIFYVLYMQLTKIFELI